jgi:hypothetical protein
MKIVERLLMREEIDSLELDLARARNRGDASAVSEISACIARLEATLAVAYRGDPIACNKLERLVRRAA